MPSPSKETLRALLSASLSPENIRRSWLRSLMEHFDAQLGLIHNVGFHERSGNIIATDAIVEGTKRHKLLEAFGNGKVGKDTLDGVETLVPMNRFGDCQRTTIPRMLLYLFWVPNRINSSLSMNVVEDGRFVGHISLFRKVNASEPYNGTELRGQGRQWQRDTITLLSTTHALMVNGPKKRATFLYTVDGHLSLQSKTDLDWADERFMEIVRDVVSDFLGSGDEEREVQELGAHLKLTALGEGSERAVLVVVEPLLVPELSAMCMLSPTQRLVASYAAKGSTINEIATTMSRSRETVKTHLKTIYERLEINSRSELAALYESALVWTPKGTKP